MPGRPSGAAKKKEAGKQTLMTGRGKRHCRQRGGRQQGEEGRGHSQGSVLSSLTG